MSRKRGPIGLYLDYLPVYHAIQKNPRAQKAMANDPGVKWMRRGNLVVWAIVFVIYMIGVLFV